MVISAFHGLGSIAQATRLLFQRPGCPDRSQARVDTFCYVRRMVVGTSRRASRRGSHKEMPNHRKILIHIATSADCFIARKNGGIDWLDRPSVAGDYGMGKFFKSIDTILWGRKTYDLVLKFQKEGKATPDMGGGIKNYAFSRKPPKKVLDGFEFVTEPIRKFAKRLRAQKGKDIWMMGGGG